MILTRATVALAGYCAAMGASARALDPAELRACAAGARVAALAAEHATDLQVVVRGPAPGRLRAAEVARAVGLPLAASIRAEPELARALERGEAPAATGKGPLATVCRRLVAQLDPELAAEDEAA